MSVGITAEASGIITFFYFRMFFSESEFSFQNNVKNPNNYTKKGWKSPVLSKKFYEYSI